MSDTGVSGGSTAIRIGSLCSGYGGLELGLVTVLGGAVAWHAELDDDAAQVLASNAPAVPNLGDITTTAWSAVDPVDWLAAGFPCQPASAAGKRQGMNDERWLWDAVANAVEGVRPRWVLLENVPGLFSVDRGRAFERVIGDLAALGYVGRWGVVRASDAGAPHARARVFIVASDATSDCAGTGRTTSNTTRSGTTDPARRGTEPLADAEPSGRDGRPHESQPAGRSRRRAAAAGGGEGHLGRCAVAADATGDGRHEGWPESAGQLGRPDAAERGAVVPDSGDRSREPQRPCAQSRNGGAATPDAGGSRLGERPADAPPKEAGADAGDEPPSDRGLRPAVQWGPYRPAIERWEAVTGRPAPRPTSPGRRGERLSPAFVEWLMGLPAGWVSDVPISRNAQLRVLGNGVVPQQAALAVSVLHHNASEVAA